jgi:hypothetical protein
MGKILEAGKGSQENAEEYFDLFHANMLARLQSIVAKAESKHSWEFMDGCFKQATELYVLASILYEKYPAYVIMSDGAFDGLAKFLRDNFKKLDPEFCHWYTVTAIDLAAGTGHHVTERPNITSMLKLVVGEDYGQHTPKVSRKLIRRKRPSAKTAGRRMRIVRSPRG